MPFAAAIPLITSGVSLLGKLFGGGAKGQADERGQQNQFIADANRNRLQQYGTQQNALLSSLLAGGRDKMDAYQTRQGASTNAMQGQQAATSNALNNQSQEGLQRAQLGLQAPSVRARQSVMGSLMKNLQPTRIQSAPGQQGHTSSITGGLSAAALDPTTRQHGDELMNSALMAQLSGSDVPAATDFKSGIQDWKSSVLDVPEATDYSKGILAPPVMQGYKEPGKMESILSGGGMLGGILGELLKLRGGGNAAPPDTGAYG
jgi:hypothetical protein